MIGNVVRGLRQGWALTRTLEGIFLPAVAALAMTGISYASQMPGEPFPQSTARVGGLAEPDDWASFESALATAEAILDRIEETPGMKSKENERLLEEVGTGYAAALPRLLPEKYLPRVQVLLKRIYQGAARIALEREDPAKARVLAELAVENGYADGFSHHLLGCALGDLTAREDDASKLEALADRAVSEFDAAIRLGVKNPEKAYASKGYILAIAGDCANGVAACDLAIRANPRHYIGHFNKAWILEKMGNHLGAEASYVKALELQPNDPGLHGPLIDLLNRQGKHDEAAFYLIRLFELRRQMDAP